MAAPTQADKRVGNAYERGYQAGQADAKRWIVQTLSNFIEEFEEIERKTTHSVKLQGFREARRKLEGLKKQVDADEE
jgi:ribosome modulation factor